MKNGILILILLILALFSVSGIYAADVNDSLVASEYTNQIELSDSDKVIEDNLQTSEENEDLASTDYDEAIAQTDTEVLGADSATYSDLAEEIRHPGNITLIHKNYTYDWGAILISEDNKVIDGNGAVIDMNGSTIRAFHVSGYGVTIKNLTIKNANYDGDGGAIYFGSTGNVTNCNFINNKATTDDSYGGAVCMYSGTVENCNFVNNTATDGYGGAIRIGFGTVTNCNFTDNSASYGGAVCFWDQGTVTNCNFTGNSASGDGGAVYFQNTGSVTNCNFTNTGKGGAIFSRLWYTTVDTCIFKRNSGDNVNTVIYPPTLNVNNFTTVYGSSEKLTFDLKTNSSIPVPNGNILISVYFKGNGEWVRNYTCLSGEGWIPDLPVGSYIAFFDTEYAKFQKINRTLKISDGTTFWDLNQTINADTQSEINLINNYTFNPDYDADFVEGIVINRSVTINGNGSTINAKGKARIFEVLSDNVVLKNIIFKNGNITGDGGAVHFGGSGTVENCNFTNNSADYAGGAIHMYSGSVENCIFINNTARYGGAIRFYNNGTTTNCNFTNNKAIGTNPWGGAICFSNIGNITNCNFADNTATDLGGAVFFYDKGTVTNCNFVDNKATGDYSYGGAINMDSGTVTNCNFTDNTATEDGGAVYFYRTGTVANCNFTGNNATYGGAVYFYYEGNVTNCNFTGNNANRGSAIYFDSTSATKTVSNSCFLNNRANAEALEITKNNNNITITFTGRNNLLNAIYSSNDAEVTFTNVKYWGANGIANTGNSTITPSRSNRESGQNITVGVVVNDELVLDKVYITDENGTIVLNINAGENYYIGVRHNEDSYYTEAEKIISQNIKFYANVTSISTNNKTVNITAKSNIPNDIIQGKLLFILPNGTQIEATYGANGTWWAEHTFDAYGEYKVNATYVGLDNVTVNNATITVNKIKTELSGNAITTTYNINKDLIITLKDSNGNPVSGAKLIVDLNGAKTYTTDSNGQVKVSTKGLAPKAYAAKVTFNGNTNYDKSTKDIKVTVKKATPKLTAKKKTFKTTPKTKKYTIVLKDNTGKAIKKAKVTLKVKGKTYKATTNSKGKATFKITNLNKKGTFKATVTYKGNKYYNKLSEKAKIKVIVTFKTVSKGSKDKATVKEIQQALKDKGYYLTYQGHYLKVDGKFSSCTFRSVKEFQKDKGLKVTGKVDEKTARKLGII